MYMALDSEGVATTADWSLIGCQMDARNANEHASNDVTSISRLIRDSATIAEGARRGDLPVTVRVMLWKREWRRV